MLRDLVYIYYVGLSLLATALFSDFAMMPTPFNALWKLAPAALPFAIPVAVYSLWSRDYLLWLLLFFFIVYVGFVLLPFYGLTQRLVPNFLADGIHWMFIVLNLGIPALHFLNKRKSA
jgi:hypothetical protein